VQRNIAFLFGEKVKTLFMSKLKPIFWYGTWSSVGDDGYLGADD
jgi:hypothetical protein